MAETGSGSCPEARYEVEPSSSVIACQLRNPLTPSMMCRSGMLLMHVMIFLCSLFISYFSPLCIAAPENTPTSFCPPALEYRVSLALDTTFAQMYGKVTIEGRVYNLGAAKHGRIAVYLTKHSATKLLSHTYVTERKSTARYF
jgi:hypothetical protein